MPQGMAQHMERVLTNLYGNLQSKESLEISATLRDIGFDHQAEVDPDSINTTSTAGRRTMMMAIDFASVEQRIAVEVDGPSHFLKAVGTHAGPHPLLTRRRNGPTQAKQYHLQQLGWTVLSLDFRDCQTARQAGRLPEFLRDQLDAAVT